jgi:ubiquinone/menaquinone biosynthesis C-methylase UbiE
LETDRSEKSVQKLHLVSAKDPDAQVALQKLHSQLISFYNGEAIAQYYQQAHRANEVWLDGTHQWLLRQQVSEGMKLLDLGCGSGHAFLNLRDIAPKYTGIDWSEEIIKKNIVNYGGEAEFLLASIYSTGLPDCAFDLVFSLYVLEHLVWPHMFLKEMFRLAKRGGLIIVICPNYRTFGRIPSFWYGNPGPLRSKLLSKNVFDTVRHFFLSRIYYPMRLKIEYSSDKFPFLINLQPACLSNPWTVDSDAVYIVDRGEVIAELISQGANDITEQLLNSFERRTRPDRSVCFVAVRKR